MDERNEPKTEVKQSVSKKIKIVVGILFAAIVVVVGLIFIQIIRNDSTTRYSNSTNNDINSINAMR